MLACDVTELVDVVLDVVEDFVVVVNDVEVVEAIRGISKRMR